ncbi:MAG: FG-GAP-like repeat-containing protein [Polyangiales bacterium]
MGIRRYALTLAALLAACDDGSTAPGDASSDAFFDDALDAPLADDTADDTPAEQPPPPDAEALDAATDAAPDALQPLDVALDASSDTALDAPRLDASLDAPRLDVASDAPRDTAAVDAPRDTVIDTPRDTVIDAPRDTVIDTPRVDVALDTPSLDVARDVAADAPRDAAPVDTGPPRPACPAVASGGSATVRAPTMLLGLRDMGTESWLSAPAVADLDRDGSMEVIAGRETRVVVWRASGALRWGASPGTQRVWAPPVIGDFIGDASLEVVVAGGDRIAMYTATGAMAPGFPVRFMGEVRALAGGDLDGDGRPEIVAASTTTTGSGAREDVMTAYRANGTVLRGFPPNGTGTSRCDGACDIAGAFDQNIAVGPLDGDAQWDVVVPTDNAYVSWHHGSGEAFTVSSIFMGVTRSPGVRFFTDLANAQQGYAMNEATAEQAHFTTSAPAIVDLDGDGAREIVVLGSIQNAAQTDIRRGVGLFVVRPDGTRPPAWLSPFQVRPFLSGLEDFPGVNVTASTRQVSVADLDAASPGMEVVFAAFDGRLWCVGADRSMRWSFQFTTATDQLTAGAAVADLSGDGRPEVVFATYSTARNTSALYVLDARGAQLHRVALPGRGAMSVPAIADVNGDGALEIVVNLKDAAPDETLVFTVPGSATNCLPWPVGRATLLRNGYVAR